MIQYDKRLFLIQMESLLKTELVKINVFLQNLKKKEENSVSSINWIKQVKHIMVKINKIDIFLPTNEKQVRYFYGWMDIAWNFVPSLLLLFNH